MKYKNILRFILPLNLYMLPFILLLSIVIPVPRRKWQAIAQTGLGYCYLQGEGVEKDEREAVKWYRKAAK